jgi:hypothetical protein
MGHNPEELIGIEIAKNREIESGGQPVGGSDVESMVCRLCRLPGTAQKTRQTGIGNFWNSLEF